MTESEAMDIAAMFVAGACSAAMSHGMNEKDASDFAIGLYKDAAVGKRRVFREEEDDDEDEDTFWGRNKGWLLPTLVGTGAFLLGANSGRAGRVDRDHFTNALHYMYNASRKILGLSDDPYYNMMTKARNYGKKLLPDSGYQAESAPVDLLKRLGEQSGSGTGVA